jgi:metallophosphoesterase superfamily enzyme
MLTDRLNYKTFEPCWIKANFIKWKFQEKFKTDKIPNILIMPTFNKLCGGIAINREGVVGPIGRLIDLKKAEVYLLDGTFLGKVQDLKHRQE